MLISMKEIKTKTYKLEKGFLVDIVTQCRKYEAWIYHKNYGIKDLMFGVPKEQQSYEQFLDLVDGNVNEYIDNYIDEHFD